MGIIAKVGGALQQVFGRIAEEAAEASGVIVRKRKFTGLSLARTFVLGYLRNPEATDEELAQIAVQSGADVTPQAIDQRHTVKLVKFLHELFCRATKVVVGSDQALAPILERFTDVIVLDSTTITLPDSMREEFAGCGGRYGSGAAAMKLQTEWDLRGGAVTHVEIEPGRSPDAATSRQDARRGPGSLRITDLGYFNVPVFAAMTKEGEYFLSRLQFGTSVVLPEQGVVALLPWLAKQAGPFIDRPIVLGKEQRLACRLIAWRSTRGTGESSAAEVANGHHAQARPGAECRTLGMVRLDDLGDQCAGRDDDARGSSRPVPRPLASGVAVQALEVARPGGSPERLDGGSANGGGLGAFIGGPGAALAGAGQRLGRSHEELEQSQRSGPRLRGPFGGRPGSAPRTRAHARRRAHRRSQNLPTKQTLQTGHLRTA